MLTIMVLLCLLFYIDHGIKGYYFYTCANNQSISCNSGKIVLIALYGWEYKSTAWLTPLILEQCNSHNSCIVPNQENKCISGIYGCVPNDRPILEIKKSSTVKCKCKTNSTTRASLYLTSENYIKGQYMDAETINCHLSYTEENMSKINSELHMDIYEFSPFVNSTKFCLKLSNNNKKIQCSGWKNFYSSYGPYLSQNGWQIHFILSDGSAYTPRVRFWLRFEVTGEGNIELECTSKPVTGLTSKPTKDTNIMVTDAATKDAATKDAATKDAWNNQVISVIAVLSSVCIIFAAAFVWVMIKYRRQVADAKSTPTHEVAQPEYNEINENYQDAEQPVRTPITRKTVGMPVLPSVVTMDQGYMQPLPSGQRDDHDYVHIQRKPNVVKWFRKQPTPSSSK